MNRVGLPSKIILTIIYTVMIIIYILYMYIGYRYTYYDVIIM